MAHLLIYPKTELRRCLSSSEIYELKTVFISPSDVYDDKTQKL